MKRNTFTFVMPHFRTANDESKSYLDMAVQGIVDQTDSNWQLIIVDDASPSQEVRRYLHDIKSRAPDKIALIFNERNRGPGFCRNQGIKYAVESKSSVVLFNDADDISHPQRVSKVRQVFGDNPAASVVYSHFSVIDENGMCVGDESITPDVLKILLALRENPPQGENTWITIGTETDYINLTSSTAVKTELAYKYPFVNEWVSEDSHTWFRYSAGGEQFCYQPEIPTLYRIPQNSAGSASRSRVGGREKFYAKKVEVDTDGFSRAIEIALARDKVSVSDREELMVKFYLRLARNMFNESQFNLALDLVDKAFSLSVDISEKIINGNKKKYQWINEARSIPEAV